MTSSGRTDGQASDADRFAGQARIVSGNSALLDQTAVDPRAYAAHTSHRRGLSRTRTEFAPVPDLLREATVRTCAESRRAEEYQAVRVRELPIAIAAPALQQEFARRIAAVETAQVHAQSLPRRARRTLRFPPAPRLSRRALTWRASAAVSITNAITAGLTAIERARGFLEAATLSDEWVRRMSQRALLVEAHPTTHIEGTELTLEQAEQLWAGGDVGGGGRMTCGSCSIIGTRSTSCRNTWAAGSRSRRR